MEDPKTKSQIRPFVEFFRINMQEFTPSDIDAYGVSIFACHHHFIQSDQPQSFQDFFIRHHTAESRPIHAADDPTIAVCSADARVVVYDRVSIAQKTWIKGHHFSLTALVGSKAPDDQAAQEAVKFADGAIASFRLSPQDYHRYHSPVTGTVRWYKELDGEYYQVDPLALRSPIDILSRNARSVVCIETKEFGDVLFVAIGATDVGSVKLSEKAKAPGASVKKGDELGIFEFGGSSIVVAFEQRRIQFDEDLVSVSKRAVMMDVEVGMSMGKATKLGV